MAYYTVELWEVKHPLCHSYCPFLLFNTIALDNSSILFGLAAMLFPEVPIGALQNYTISPLRPFVGIVFASAIYFTGATKYLGLESLLLSNFSNPSEYYDFLLKILFTDLP
jgi:hypothetical protein